MHSIFISYSTKDTAPADRKRRCHHTRRNTMNPTSKTRAAVAWILLAALLGSLAGCGAPSDMPYSGDIRFHDMSVTIPGSFVRDSTQSHEDLWVFEKGFYSQLIILTRNDITGEVAASLDDYVAYMKEQGADSQRETFLQMDAVSSVYTKDGVFCQEMLFAYNGSFYAIALRGGTKEDFQALLNTIRILTPQ